MSESSQRSRTGPDLLVFADDWGRHPSSAQHLVRHLLDRYRVDWVNTIGTRPPRLDRATWNRGVETLRHWRAGTGAVPSRSGQPANLQVHQPPMWPWFRTGLDRRLNRALLLRALRPLTPAGTVPPVAVTTVPIVADLIGRLPVRRWVYYCVDDLAEWPGLDGATLRTLEQPLLQRCDRIIAAGESLRWHCSQSGRSAAVLTHGVDLDHWKPRPALEPLTGMADLPQPWLVYWGLIDRRLDPEFLRHLGARLDRGTILLVGPELDPDPHLDAVPRVARRPALPYEQLPALAQQAAVLLFPYADSPVTRAIQPLKLREYLASGRPAVGRDLPGTRPWHDALDLEASPEAFAERVLQRLQTGVPESQRLARGRLASEAWSRKSAQFAHLIGLDEAGVDRPRLSTAPGGDVAVGGTV